jgi:hypothetical protein
MYIKTNANITFKQKCGSSCGCILLSQERASSFVTQSVAVALCMPCLKIRRLMAQLAQVAISFTMPSLCPTALALGPSTTKI